MTVEKIQSEKKELESRIKEAVRDFSQRTGRHVSGKFETRENTVIMGMCMATEIKPIVTVNPIEI